MYGVIMKKILKIGIGIILLTQLSLEAKTWNSFVKNVAKASKSKSDDFARLITKNSKTLTKQIQTKLDNIPSVPKVIKKDPAKALIVAKGNSIVKKGKFEEQFFLTKPYDSKMAIIVQSSKYGDEYFTIAKKISTKDLKLLRQNKTISKYVPDSKYQNLTENQLQKKFIDALEYTGDTGWKALKEIGKFAKNHPSWTGAIASYLYFSIDPNGFMENVHELTKSATKFAIIAGTGIASGIYDEGKEEVNSKIDDIKSEMKEGVYTSLSNIIGGFLVLVFTFLIWKKRKIISNYIMKPDELKRKKIEDEKEDDEF